MDEPFEIFDAEGNALGIALRSRVHREGLWHRASNVFLFRSDGGLIIQRRQWDKDVCPGVWDLSAAEHLTPGETYEQAAVRGLREELGIAAVELERVGPVTRTKLEIPAQGIKDYELQQSFRGVFDGDIRANVSEVCEVQTIALQDLSVALKERRSDFTPWFRNSAVSLGILGAQASPACSVELARIDDLQDVVACDDLSRDPSRRRSIESWVKRGECLVGRRNGSVVGFVVVEYGFFGHGFVPLLCVKSTERRQGFGLDLLAAAERACWTAKVFTSTNTSNAAARSLFERAGFVPSGTIENLDADDPELVYFKHRSFG